MESLHAETGFTLLLTGEEREALLRVLQVVEDNWWLDEVERDLLERIHPVDAAFIRPAA